MAQNLWCGRAVMTAALLGAAGLLPACPMAHTEADGGVRDGATSDVLSPTDSTEPSDASDAGGGPDAPASLVATYRSYCERLMTAICAGYASCCTRSGRDGGREICPTIVNACREIRADDPAFDALEDGSLIVSELYTAYFAALDAALETCAAWPADPPTGLLFGRLGVGDDCTPSSLTWPMETYRCTPGLFCAVSGPAAGGWSGVCAAPGDIGAHCYVNDACSEGLYCRIHSAPATEACTGRCEARVPAGAACDDDSQCETEFCTGTCVERLPSDDWCEPMYGR